MNSDKKHGDFDDHYRLLGVGVGAAYTEIRTAYVRMAKQLHPDAGGTTDGMQQLNRAYKTLMDPVKRAAYDKVHSMYHKAAKDMGYREDYAMPRGYATGTQVTNDEYADFFIDMVNRDLEQSTNPSWSQRVKSATAKARKSFRL